MSEAFCVGPFVLQRQQPKEDKQTIDFAPLEKFLRMPMTETTALLHAVFNIVAE